MLPLLEIFFILLRLFRKYVNGSVLSMHVDTANTHVVSCIINVDQEVEEDWKLVILDHEENEHSITMRPGDMLLYESAKLLHGRPSKCLCCS
jgi:prolyl 4-hydroxylase